LQAVHGILAETMRAGGNPVKLFRLFCLKEWQHFFDLWVFPLHQDWCTQRWRKNSSRLTFSNKTQENCQTR